MEVKDYKSNDQIAWCPGCGNFGILTALKKAFAALDKKPKDTLVVSGIGQAAKLPHYIQANCFNGLHGRALPVASAAKMTNPKLSVVVTTGDGDCYGEGGNHFLHNIRRNTDITVITHNNQIYGLTKGQASPTTDPGFVTKVQTKGVKLTRFNALGIALAAGSGFVARGFSRGSDQLSELMVEAIKFKGFSLLEVLQPCVSFNNKNTYQWYSDRIYDLGKDDTYDQENPESAFAKSLEWGEKIPIGIFYKSSQETFLEKMGTDKKMPLEQEGNDIGQIFRDFS